MKPITAIRILLLASFIAAVAVSSCSRHDNRFRFGDLNPSDHVEKISEELKLTQSQSKELEAFISDLEDKKVLVQKGHNIMDMVVQELGSDQFDEESVEQAVSHYLSEVEVVSLKLVRDLSTFHDSLSDEQRTKLDRHLHSKDLVHDYRHR